MAMHRGRGIASVNYPIGMNLGGDPSQALVHSNPTGNFMVTLSSIDLGQGMKSVTRQICAETLGVPVEDVYVDTADTDTGPHCMGIVRLARHAPRRQRRHGRRQGSARRDDGGGRRGAGGQRRRPRDRRPRQHPRQGRAAPLDLDQGRRDRRAFQAGQDDLGPRHLPGAALRRRPETGEMSPATCYAHACTVAEVEVDDETGEVAMVRMDSAYEVGRALNPRLVEQQLVGGAWMGISHALYETTEPYYPDPSHGPRDFDEYLMPGPGDICPHDIAVLERPAADGPFGAKGPGEMCANPLIPAVANAIFDAVGVRIDDLPITPEKVLRAIKAQGGARPQARR